MAERTPPSRRAQDKRGGERQAAPSRRSTTDKQAAPRRSDVIRCENCGEDYSITYKRCPFCDERPGRTGIGGRRVADGSKAPVHPIQVISLVVSLIIIIIALFIVFKYIGPLIFGEKDPAGSGSSAGTSQIDGSSGDQSQLDGSGDISSAQGGDVSEPEDVTQVESTVSSISLNRSDITLQANEAYQFTATVSPAGAEVTWSSSDPSVLTVDEDGIVRNVNSGSEQVQVTVTATAGDKSAQCIVRCRGGSTASSGSNTSSEGSSTTEPSGSGETTTTPVSPNTPGTITNAGDGLNVRSGPGSSYEKVASIKNGDKIIILEDAGDGWYKIDYGAGKTGYVSSDYVTPGG